MKFQNDDLAIVKYNHPQRPSEVRREAVRSEECLEPRGAGACIVALVLRGLG